jgi:ABC-type lipoprotein export system ATPase subunit
MKERFYFKDQQGEKLIIVGSSGSGKTLFLSLLKQLYFIKIPSFLFI